MSTEIGIIKNSGTKGETLNIDQFSGGNKGVMLQLTQGFGGCASLKQLNKDEPGYIQLTRGDAESLLKVISNWLTKD